MPGTVRKFLLTTERNMDGRWTEALLRLHWTFVTDILNPTTYCLWGCSNLLEVANVTVLPSGSLDRWNDIYIFNYNSISLIL